MNKHNEATMTPSGLQLLTVPVRLHSFLNEKVKRCVEMENKTAPADEKEMTAQDFIRIAVAEKVGRTLNEDVSSLPPVIRGRGGTLVAQLAKRMGMSQEELAKRVAETFAARAFGYKEQSDDLIMKVLSGELPVIGGNQPAGERRPASKSGQHQITTHQSGPGVRSARRSS